MVFKFGDKIIQNKCEKRMFSSLISRKKRLFSGDKKTCRRFVGNACTFLGIIAYASASAVSSFGFMHFRTMLYPVAATRILINGLMRLKKQYGK